MWTHPLTKTRPLCPQTDTLRRMRTLIHTLTNPHSWWESFGLWERDKPDDLWLTRDRPPGDNAHEDTHIHSYMWTNMLTWEFMQMHKQEFTALRLFFLSALLTCDPEIRFRSQNSHDSSAPWFQTLASTLQATKFTFHIWAVSYGKLVTAVVSTFESCIIVQVVNFSVAVMC